MFSLMVQVIVSLFLVRKGSEGSENGLYNNLVSLTPGTEKEKVGVNCVQLWYEKV